MTGTSMMLKVAEGDVFSGYFGGLFFPNAGHTGTGSLLMSLQFPVAGTGSVPNGLARTAARGRGLM